MYTLLLQKKIKSNFIKFQHNIDTYANHILVLIAFFLPIQEGVIHDGFQILLMLFLLTNNKIQKLKNAFSNPIVLSFILFSFIQYIWIIPSDNQKISYYEAKELKFFLFSILVFTFAKYSFSKRIITSFLLGTLFSAVLSYGLILQILPEHFIFSGVNRATYANPSPFVYHIQFGFILAFSSVLVLQKYYIQTSNKHKIIFASLFLFLTVCLFLNNSRSGYILYFIGIAIFYLTNNKENILKKSIYFLLFTFFTLAMAYQFSNTFENNSKRLINSVKKAYVENNYNTSFGFRIIEMKQGYNLFLEKPFIGYGTQRHVHAMYEDAKEKKIFYAKIIKKYNTTDNQYLDLLLQFGIIGLLVFLNIFYQAFKYKQKDPYLQQIKTILLILYAIYSLQTHSMGDGLVPYIFFFIITLTIVEKKENESELSTISIKQFFIYSILAIISISTYKYIL